MIRPLIHFPQTATTLVSTDETRLDLDTVHGFLAGSYWAAGIPREVVERSIRHSICFGAFDRARQVASRVITDGRRSRTWPTSSVDSHRGRGIGKQIMAAVTSHPELRTCASDPLHRDAHGLYRRSGLREASLPIASWSGGSHSPTAWAGQRRKPRQRRAHHMSTDVSALMKITDRRRW
jgi:hypothetical protein